MPELRFEIDGILVASQQKPYVIAEAGVNHDGELSLAKELITAAKQCGAHAVKFQCFRAQDLVDSQTPRADYQQKNTSNTGTQFELLSALELSDDDFQELASYAHRTGITFLCSPHTEAAAVFLRDLVPAFKLGSGDLTNRLLIEQVASYGKPMILGTGMSSMTEVQRAYEWCQAAGNSQPLFLHCTSNYPCPPQEVQLDAMTEMASTLGLAVGYSDHTEGLLVPVMAASLGAVLIEKHFTLDCKRSGPDHAASMEPEDFTRLTQALRSIPTIRQGRKQATDSERALAPQVRKSLVLKVNLPAGTVLCREHLMSKRPEKGVASSELTSILGKTLEQNTPAGTYLQPNMLKEKSQ